VGAALALGRAERRVNVGVLVFAALLLDLLLWVFILLGGESVTIPADFARTHQPQFVFPYSHGLLAGLGWSALAGVLVLWRGYPRAAWVVAAAIFSHWLLDALVHVPELPLAGPGSPKAGLGLWQHMPVALAVEGLIVVAGLVVFVPRSGLSRPRRVALGSLAFALLAFTIVGMTVAPAPPSATAMAASSAVTILVICALTWWLARGTPSRI
jgi:hypothetical protein